MLKNNKKSKALVVIVMTLIMLISVLPANTVTAQAASSTVKTGSTVTDKYTKAKYKVTGKKTVTYVKTTDTKSKTITVPACIKVGKTTYSVTAVGKNAFNNNKKATTIVIGKNVSKIAKGAFNSCSKVKVLTIKSTKLTSKNVTKSTLTGLKKSATVYVPSSKKTSYKKILGRTVKVCKHKYKTKSVTSAWSETVVDKAAYDETVVDEEEYDSYEVVGHKVTQNDTGDDLTDIYNNSSAMNAWCVEHHCCWHGGYDPAYGDGYCAHNYNDSAVYDWVHHDAVTHTVHHNATYKTVNHSAAKHTETYCTTCGITK